MSERSTGSENPKTYKGWTVLPCPVPMPPWPQQRYFLGDRLGAYNEFEMTTYEDFVDAYCHEHAYAKAEYVFGKNWGTVSRVEWITEEGQHRVSEIKKVSRLHPDGTRSEVNEPQRAALPEWLEAVKHHDEAAIVRLLKEEIKQDSGWLNPTEEMQKELSDLAEKQAKKLRAMKKEWKKKSAVGGTGKGGAGEGGRGGVSAAPLPALERPQDGDPDRRMVSLRLTGEARSILLRLSEAKGISQAAVLEVLLREATRSMERP